VLASDDGAHSLEFKGIIQADGRFFLTDRNGVSSFVLRRVRPAIDAKIFRHYEFRFQPDFAGSRVQVLDAWGNLHFWDEIQLRVGKGKGPVGLERLQSPRDMLFAERAFPSQLAPNRDIGAQLHGKVADGLLEWAVGVYNGVPNGGSGDVDTNDSKDIEARVFLLPFQKLDIDALSGLGVGFAATFGNQFGATPSYVTSGQQTFFSYASSTSAFGERTLLAPQAYYYAGPISLMWEFTRVKEHLENFTTGASGTVGTTAWQLAGSLTAGGKPSYKGVKVGKPLDPENGGFGALELSGRYHDLRVGDLAFERNFANRNTAAQRASAFSGFLLNSSLLCATSASVVCSSTSTLAAYASRRTVRTAHVASSLQPSQRRYAVLLRHGTGAIGPSSARSTAASVIASGAFARRYPPPRPLRLRTKPCCLSSARIASRNFFGMSSCSAMSAIRIGSPGAEIAKRASALMAYFAFIVIMDAGSLAASRP
jgi:phosphate-selective porin OprO and OprP